MDDFERSRNNSNNSRQSSRTSRNRPRQPKFKQPSQGKDKIALQYYVYHVLSGMVLYHFWAALEAFVKDRLEAGQQARERLPAQTQGVGYISNRQEVLPDPLARRDVRRQSTLRRGFERSVGTIRKSGRHVRKKAIDTRRSIRRATKRPVIPYNHLRRIQADEVLQVSMIVLFLIWNIFVEK